MTDVLRLMVVELDDVIPRRDPNKPNLYVGLIKDDPEIRFKRMVTRKGGWTSGHVVKLRNDLAPSTKFASKDRAETTQRRLTQKLKSQGYTVNMDTKIWKVYVIELDPSATSDPGKGYIYVGETSKTPEERFIEHTTGKRNSHGRLYSEVVRRHGRKLRPDLAPKRIYFDSSSSKRAEKETFIRLQEKGYKVRGGH